MEVTVLFKSAGVPKTYVVQRSANLKIFSAIMQMFKNVSQKIMQVTSHSDCWLQQFKWHKSYEANYDQNNKINAPDVGCWFE